MAAVITIGIFAIAGRVLGGTVGLAIGAVVGVIFIFVVGSLANKNRRTQREVDDLQFVEELKREHSGRSVEWRPMKVAVDFLPGVYESYSTPMRWGEYAWPHFTESETTRVLADLARAGGSSRYDQSLDSFFVRGPHERKEAQVWGHAGEMGKTYSVGAGQWRWREAP